MQYLTLLLFLLYCYGLGFSLTFFTKNVSNFLERNLMRVGIGLGVLPILSIFLSLIRIPLDWKIFLILSLVTPLFYFFKNFNKLKNLKPKITKSSIYIIIVLLLFLVTFYMYHKGAFAYPYLEDDDPWSHAVGVKFVSVEKNIFTDKAKNIQYINPYPPGYDVVLGILNQTSSSLMWTLKYFNALFVSFSIIFFYFFVKEFTGDKKRALFSTIALVAIPCFLSHFIWAIALCVPLYFVAFYCLEKIKSNKSWIFPSVLVIASTLILTPTHSTYFGLFFILYFITKTILERKFLKNLFLSGFLGLLISFLFWWLPMVLKHGLHKVLQGMGIGGESVWSISGTGDRLYTLGDFIFAKPQNMINNPIGIGVFLSILVALSLFFIFTKYKSLLNEKNHWVVIVLVWLAFTLYAVNGARFPIKLSSFRTWMLLAIPVSILAGEAIFVIISFCKSIEKVININFVIRGGAIILIILGLWFTSGYQKYTVNTTPGWPPGAFWASMEELEGYLWLKNLPPDTKVFSFTNDGVIIGFDKFTCAWCEDVVEFKKIAINKTAEELHNWLKENKYEYLTIGGQESREFGSDVVNNKMQEIGASNLFQPVYQTKGVIVFKII